MTAKPDGVEFNVSRTVVVHVSGALDAAATEQLRRILHDLIENQGLNDLIVDLSGVSHAAPQVSSVLEAARDRMVERGGTLILQVTADPPSPLVDLATELPTFAPLTSGQTRLG